MNTFDPATRTFRNAFDTHPYYALHLPPHWRTQNDMFDPLPSRSYHIPHDRPFYHCRRSSDYRYNPLRLRPRNQRPHPQWRPYRNVRIEECFRSENLRPHTRQRYRQFEWGFPDFDGAFEVERDVSSAGQLGKNKEDEVISVPGYAETIPDEVEDFEMDDGCREDCSDAHGHPRITEVATREDTEYLDQDRAAAQQAMNATLDMRWVELWNRESHRAVWEDTLKEKQDDLMSERAKFGRAMEKLGLQQFELQRREVHLVQLESQLWDKQQRFQKKCARWKDWVMQQQHETSIAQSDVYSVFQELETQEDMVVSDDEHECEPVNEDWGLEGLNSQLKTELSWFDKP